LEIPVPSQGHYGFHSFPVVDWFCLFIYLWVLTYPLEDCSEFGNFAITLINYFINVIKPTAHLTLNSNQSIERLVRQCTRKYITPTSQKMESLTRQYMSINQW